MAGREIECEEDCDCGCEEGPLWYRLLVMLCVFERVCDLLARHRRSVYSEMHSAHTFTQTHTRARTKEKKRAGEQERE